MPSKPARIVPLLSVITSESRGLGRRYQSAVKPDCPKCGHAEHIVRMWHGPKKYWVCSEHYKIGSGLTLKQTFRERLFHKPPKEVMRDLTDVLPNRRARRQATR